MDPYVKSTIWGADLIVGREPAPLYSGAMNRKSVTSGS